MSRWVSSFTLSAWVALGTASVEAQDVFFLDAPTPAHQAPSHSDDPVAQAPQPRADAPSNSPDGQALADKPPKAKKPPAKPPNPYKGLYYDNDFSYLNKEPPKYLGDHFKQLEFVDCFVLDLGGEYRLRDHHEHDLRGSNLTGQSDDFLLQRTRLYANAKYADWLRAYVEAIDATSSYEQDPPRTIEENRFDALNLFGDVRLLENGDGGALWGRVGRQEILYGDQRLISPLDWANTRRTFDGAKLFYRSKDWDVDGFWLRPVPFNQHVMNDHNFDHPDQSQEFVGLYSSYKGCKDQTREFYFLRLAEYDGAPVDYDANLLGTRWKGKRQCWLWEFEGGYQFGEFGALSHSAGFVTLGLGREWSQWKWKPTLWAYYDWASGDSDPTDGTHGTFNQLFPLGHKYFGFCDLVARQNIRDFNLLLTAQPHKKVNLLCWWHLFQLDQARDALYNANGAVIRSDPTGASGRDVGQEIDITLTYAFNPRCDVLFGYSHFFAGDFVKNTNPAGVSGNVDFYYSQWSYRF